MVYDAVHFHDDDLAQEAREAIVLAARSWRPGMDCTMLSWMNIKARYRVISAYRTRTGYGRVDNQIPLRHDGTDRVRLASDVDDPGDRYCDEMAAVDQVASLDAVLELMSVRDRGVIGRWGDGVPQVDIARHYGIDPARVSQIITRYRREASLFLRLHVLVPRRVSRTGSTPARRP